MSIVVGQKATNQIAQHMVECWRGFHISQSKDGRREHSEGLRVIFGVYSDIVENDIHTMQRFLRRLQIFVLGKLAGMVSRQNTHRQHMIWGIHDASKESKIR